MDHVGHDHHHDHEHGHSHSHDHHATDEAIEELLSIGICGAFGVVATILGYYALSGHKGMLSLLLVPQFFPWVLGGGIALLFMAAIRGIILWVKAGHVHTNDCDHSHDHEHTHGGAAWRTIVLLFPLVLFALDLPNKNFSNDRLAKMLGQDIEISTADLKTVDNGKMIAATFEDVANALRSDALMEEMTGNTVILRGQLQKANDRQFTLFTTKMTCCASDKVPLKAKIIVLNDNSGGSLQAKGLYDFQWLEVRGVIQFVKHPDSHQPIPVIQAKLRDINPTNPE